MKVIEKVWKELKTVKEIGRGAYGNVYKCVDTDTQDYYAVKVISVPSANEGITELSSEKLSREETQAYYKEIADDLVKEIEILKSLKGTENIVEIYDARIIEKEYGIGWHILIKMELLTEFKKYSADKEFSEADVLKLGADLCRALSVCHKAKIIHRDIKPENIFVDSDGNYKLGDFGVAKQMEKTQGSMSIKGTFNYMSPEVFAGKKCDSRADMYSLAIVMYKLLNNNRLPFIDKNKETIRYSERQSAFERRIRGENIPAISGVSSEINRVILKGCAFDIIDRYKNAEEFSTQIQQLINGQKIKKGFRKSVLKKITAGLVAASVLVAAGLVVWQESKKIETDTEEITGYEDPEFITVTPGNISEKCIDGKYLYCDDSGLYLISEEECIKITDNAICNALYDGDTQKVCWYERENSSVYEYCVGNPSETPVERTDITYDSTFKGRSASIVYWHASDDEKRFYLVDVDSNDDGKADKQELYYNGKSFDVVDYIESFDDFIVFAESKNKKDGSYILNYFRIYNAFLFDEEHKNNISENWINKENTFFYQNNYIWFLEKSFEGNLVIKQYCLTSGEENERVNLSAMGITSADSVVALNDKYAMIDDGNQNYSLVTFGEDENKSEKIRVSKYRNLGDCVDTFVDAELSSRIIMVYAVEDRYCFYSVNEKGKYELIGSTEKLNRVNGLVYDIDKEANPFKFEVKEIR